MPRTKKTLRRISKRLPPHDPPCDYCMRFVVYPNRGQPYTVDFCSRPKPAPTKRRRKGGDAL